MGHPFAAIAHHRSDQELIGQPTQGDDVLAKIAPPGWRALEVLSLKSSSVCARAPTGRCEFDVRQCRQSAANCSFGPCRRRNASLIAPINACISRGLSITSGAVSWGRLSARAAPIRSKGAKALLMAKRGSENPSVPTKSIVAPIFEHQAHDQTIACIERLRHHHAAPAFDGRRCDQAVYRDRSHGKRPQSDSD